MQQFTFERDGLSVEFLKEKIAEGYEVRVAMEPDPAREGNRPHYWEMLELPYVIAGSEHFWAMSQATHYPGTHDKIQKHVKENPCSFSYSRPWDLLASYQRGENCAVIMHKNLYRSFKWKLVERWAPLWDSSKNEPDDCGAVADAISCFSSIKAVVFFDGFMFYVPVDIPAYHPQSGTCHFKMASTGFPSIFLSANNMEYLEKLLLKKTGKSANQNFSFTVSTDVGDTFFYLSTVGRTFSSLTYQGTRLYDRLIILGEKEMLAPENPRWKDACTSKPGDPA